jgi:xyloglucan-specific exo-beta-1,4-glucanase
MRSVPYVYRNAPIPGGGFVTGFAFHPKAAGVLYARTDIGGVYRFDFARRAWQPLIDHARHDGRWESFALSIALDPEDPDALYVACGDNHINRLAVSHDRGERFAYFDLPCAVHGNFPGRGAGERLLVRPDRPETLYFASQSAGLWVSRDKGKTWEPLPVRAPGKNPENNLAFIVCNPEHPDVMVVSASGAGNPAGETRGPSLYITRDGGASFALLPAQPAPIEDARIVHPGFVGQRAAFDGDTLYVSMMSVGNAWAGWNSYACDTGTSFDDGRVLRYRLDAQGYVVDSADVTPAVGFSDPTCPARRTGCGFSGLCPLPGHAGALALTSVCDAGDDAIFLTLDRGDTWVKILQGLETGRMDFTSVPYMRPCCNGGLNLIHWMSDFKINPFDGNHAVFNTGTGVFMTFNLLDALEGKPVTWQPVCEGMEETVHLNVYSPPGGDVHLIDIVGDLGGFAFADLTRPCANSFADAEGNRYITCMNADFADGQPEYVLVTPRGNWKGKTRGGLILSRDGCRTWDRLPMPYGLSPQLDALLRRIEQPNVNAGWCAVTADARTLVWGVADGKDLPASCIVTTQDEGNTWALSDVLDESGAPLDDPSATLKVMADRTNPEVLYGFGDGSTFFVSHDRGRSFRKRPAPEGFPADGLGGIDGRQPCEIRVQSASFGVIWMAMNQNGLWRVRYDLDADRFTARRVTAQGEAVYRQGMGKSRSEGGVPALYIAGTIGGAYGFYRSEDEGVTWTRINTDRQMFGDIRSMCGDPRIFGRVYVATGTRGVLWGDPQAAD